MIWNGKPLKLSVLDRAELTPSELPSLRQNGVNALVLSGESDSLWHAAERLGFIILGRHRQPRLEYLELSQSPACLGWTAAGDWPEWRERVTRMRRQILKGDFVNHFLVPKR